MASVETEDFELLCAFTRTWWKCPIISIESTCEDFLHVSLTFPEAETFRLKAFPNPKLSATPLHLRKNNIRSQAFRRTSHLKTSFWERGTELNNALRMSLTSAVDRRLGDRCPRKPFSGKTFIPGSFPVCLLCPCFATPQGSNVNLRLVNNDVSLICVIFAYSFGGVQPLYFISPWSSWVELVRIPTTALSSFNVISWKGMEHQTRLCDRRLVRLRITAEHGRKNFVYKAVFGWPYKLTCSILTKNMRKQSCIVFTYTCRYLHCLHVLIGSKSLLFECCLTPSYGANSTSNSFFISWRKVSVHVCFCDDNLW